MILRFSVLFCPAAILLLGLVGLPGCSSPEEQLAPDLGAFSHADALGLGLSVGQTEGLDWERDPGFLIPGHTVPTLLILENGYRLFSSAPQRGQIAVHQSSDGLQWTPRQNLDLSSQDESCSGMALDLSVQKRSNGYRLMVETWSNNRGLMDPSGKTAPQVESPTRFCTWTSKDGDSWTPEGALVWQDSDPTWPSGLESFQYDLKTAIYYVDTHPDLDGIRRADLRGDTVVVGPRKTLLPEAHVDPNPVHLLEGGVRLYHTRALEGTLAYSDSKNGVVFGESKPLKGLSGQLCYSPPERPSAPDACYLDPFFLRLSDGRKIMYFSIFESLPGGVERRGIGRAFGL